jgi:RNA polymerase sigma-70 factor (ECF subfamily)
LNVAEGLMAISALAIPGDQADRQERFAALVSRQSRFVYRIAYAVLRNSHDAEDAVQETFLKLYRLGGWERMQNERAFLARTAWRVAVDRRPKSRTVESEADVPSGAESPEAAAIRADSHALIHRLVDALPEELRLPLALSTVEEMNSRQIGEIMGIPEGTVRSRLMRARAILREKLGGRHA